MLRLIKRLFACIRMMSAPLFKTSKVVDDCVNDILDNGEYVKHDSYHYIFKLRGKYYGLWTENRWYGLANSCKVGEDSRRIDMRCDMVWDNIMPYSDTRLKFKKFIESIEGTKQQRLKEQKIKEKKDLEDRILKYFK